MYFLEAKAPPFRAGIQPTIFKKGTYKKDKRQLVGSLPYQKAIPHAHVRIAQTKIERS